MAVTHKAQCESSLTWIAIMRAQGYLTGKLCFKLNYCNKQGHYHYSISANFLYLTALKYAPHAALQPSPCT